MKYIYVIFLAQITFLVVGILIAVFEKKTCLSESCRELAKAIREQLNSSVNPCEDFYEFACGKVVRRSGSSGMVGDTATAQLIRIHRLLKEGLETGEPEAYAKAKRIFKKCTEDSTPGNVSTKKIQKLFQDLGGFPFIEGDKWDEAGWTWLETTRKLRERGLFVDVMFVLRPVPNAYERKISLAILEPTFPELDGCTTNLQDCETVFSDSFITNVRLFGMSKEREEEAAGQIYGLEKQLFELSEAHAYLEFDTPAEELERNITNMTASFGYIDWPKLIGIMLQKDDVPDSFKVLVSNAGYMSHLKTIFETTPKKVMANYMMWKVLKLSVWGFSLYPGNKSDDACFAFVQKTMTGVLDLMYLEHYPDPRGSDLEAVEIMVDLIKDDIQLAIRNANWMSGYAKKKSTRKIDLLKQRIGDLKIFNKTFVKDFYRGLSVDGDAFEVMMSTTKFVMDKEFENVFNVGSMVYVGLAKMHEYDLNAFYFGLDNSFNVLHGILQKPVFGPEWPASINYGRIGSIIGHEITHALDERGHLYDEHGNLKDTWDSETYEKFNKTSQCLVDQFDAFYNGSPFKSPTFSGSHKSLENMADTGGSRLAYLAYRNHTDKMFWPDFVLPGLDYSPNQLFFISYAVFWCSKEDPENMAADAHAPSRYRVLKTLRNNPHFAQVFGCRHGDGMTSGNACDVW